MKETSMRNLDGAMALKRAGLLGVMVTAIGANAAPFTLTLTNTEPAGSPSWSSGLLTLQPLIDIGVAPQPGSNQYFTYAYANAHCSAGGGNDDGNATLLAQRWGLTLGVNAWVVPPLAANGGSATVTIEAPVGARLSFIAWINDTGVFDDFVALHAPGSPTTLSVPLFNAGGQPLQSVDFVVSGFDSNSTSPTDGSGATCGWGGTAGSECPAGVGATGSITPARGRDLVDGETLTVGDGVNPPTILEFDSGGKVAVGHVSVTFTRNDTTTTIGGRIAAAINGVGATLRVTATGSDPVQLVNDATGPIGNVPITASRTNTSLRFTGMTGGGNCYVALGNASTGGAGTLPPPPTPPIASFTITSGNGQNRLTWTNNAPHTGVVVARSLSPVVWSPATGVTYTQGQVVGASTLVHVDDGANAVSSFSDPGTNGTRYFYKVFAHANGKRYASGDVPSTAGLFSIPTPGAPTSPAWCYSVGMFTTNQPYADFGAAVYSSSQARAVTGNNVGDGTERWRPASTIGVTQSRPTVVPLFGRSSKYLLAGDQSGYTYAIDVATGQTVWSGNDGGSIGKVQAQAATQLFQYTSPTTPAGLAYRAAYSNTDLVFFGTFNPDTTTNGVHAFSSVDGSKKWSVVPGNMGLVSGGMALVYETNRLWVASRAAAGQPTLRVIDTVNPAAPPTTFVLGDIDAAAYRNLSLDEVHVVTNAGVAYGFNAFTMAQNWTYPLGGRVSGYLVPAGRGFLASTAAGVQRYAVTATPLGDGGTSYAVAPQWPNPTSPAPTAISGASAARIDGAAQPAKVYVADSTGNVNRLDYETGQLEATFPVARAVDGGSMGLGMPTIDPTSSPRRLFVGGQDGRICAVDLPF